MVRAWYLPFMFVHLFCYAMLVGFMAVVLVTLVPAQHRLSGPAYTVMEQGANQVLGVLTPTLMVASLLGGLGVVGCAVRDRSRVRYLFGVGVICLIVMVVSTLTINLQVNQSVDTWNPASPPVDWAQQRDRWEFGHAIRSVVGLVGFIAALAAVIWEPAGRTLSSSRRIDDSRTGGDPSGGAATNT